MQWGSNWFGEDVSGLTRSSATAPIDQIETHGALVKAPGGARNCYEGHYAWIQNPIVTNWSSSADSGWGPFRSGAHNCWVMATGHYYIYNGQRYNVTVPDYTKRF